MIADQTKCCIVSSLPDDFHQLPKDGPSIHLQCDEGGHTLTHAPRNKAIH